MQIYDTSKIERDERGRWFFRIPYRLYDMCGFAKFHKVSVAIKQPTAAELVSPKFHLYLAPFTKTNLLKLRYLEKKLDNRPSTGANTLAILQDYANILEVRGVDRGEGEERGRLELICHFEKDPEDTFIEENFSSSSDQIREIYEKHYDATVDTVELFSIENQKASGTQNEASVRVALYSIGRINDELGDVDTDNHLTIIYDSRFNLLTVISRSHRERLVRFNVDLENRRGQLYKLLAPLGMRNVDLRYVRSIGGDGSPDRQLHASYEIAGNVRNSKYWLFTSQSLTTLLRSDVLAFQDKTYDSDALDGVLSNLIISQAGWKDDNRVALLGARAVKFLTSDQPKVPSDTPLVALRSDSSRTQATFRWLHLEEKGSSYELSSIDLELFFPDSLNPQGGYKNDLLLEIEHYKEIAHTAYSQVIKGGRMLGPCVGSLFSDYLFLVWSVVRLQRGVRYFLSSGEFNRHSLDSVRYLDYLEGFSILALVVEAEIEVPLVTEDPDYRVAGLKFVREAELNERLSKVINSLRCFNAALESGNLDRLGNLEKEDQNLLGELLSITSFRSAVVRLEDGLKDED